MNLAKMLHERALAAPDHTAILFEGTRLDYRALDEASARVAGALWSRGIRPGDRVAIFLPNLPAFAIVYYGIQRLGAVPVSINVMLRADEVEYLLIDSGARWAFCTVESAAQVPRERCPAVEGIVLVDAPGRPGAAGEANAAHAVEGLADWLAGQSPVFEPVERAPEDTAALLYSSGTTGFPKGIALTQANIASNIASVVEYSGYRSDDRLATFLPLFHVYGQNSILNAAVLAGATVVLFRRFAAEQVLETIERERVTMFFGVPTIFINLLAMDLSRYDLSSIRYEMSAAATLPEEISRRWQARFGRSIFEGYGLTETSPFACYNDHIAHRVGSIGRPIEGTELAIFDDEDREQPRGEWGEIVIRGPGVMKGYWNRPEDTARALRNGWLHTGDIGRIDEDGYAYIVDRVKDMINVSGFKVWPAEVEQHLYRMPGVREVAVYGLPHPEKGEQVVAAIVPVDGASLSSDAVIGWCREHIAAYKVPARVDIVAGLPKSATGKILKRVLRENGPDVR